ncbi:MAG: MFS transporter, partial [Ilumatobacteraceae bacterium]
MTSARRLALSAGVLFFANGATYGNWIPRLPEIKDRLGVTNSGLGVALLGGGLGGLVGSLAVGAVMSRVGSRRMVLVTMTVVAAAMTLVAFVSQAWMLLMVLSLIGLFDVCADVAINAQGVIAQEQLG